MIPEASVADLEEACSAEPSCAGFNSDGWLKSAVDPEEKWYDSQGSLYVKVYDTENPVGLAQLNSKSREDPAPPSDEFSETGSEAGADAVSMLTSILKETAQYTLDERRGDRELALETVRQNGLALDEERH